MVNQQANVNVTLNNEQAKQELNELQNQMKELIKLKREAAKSGDTARQAALAKELAEARKEAGVLQKQLFSVDQVLKRINGASINELRQAEAALVQQTKNLNRETQEYIQKTAQLKKIRAEIASINSETRATGSTFSRMADGFNRYFALFTAWTAGLAGVVLGVKAAIQSFNDFEERVGNLSALTGLAGDDLKWLSDQAKELSVATLESGIRVTQSAKDIVDAFTKVGSARPELLKDKEALVATTKEAIILANAAKTELQPAIEALTMVMNQYNAPATEARRIINAIAAGSKEGAGEIPYITTAFEKAGTVAADAGISIETLVATIETLAPRITQPEIAGRSLKGVILDLQTTSDDTNPAIVGLATALENLGKKNLSVTQLTKLFGTENITTAKILIDNVAELKKYEAAVTSTNVAIEQAATNTDNNNAKLAQAKNRMNLLSMELGQKLAPAYASIISKSSLVLQSISGIVDFTIKYGKAIVVAAAGVAGYTAAVRLAAVSDGVWLGVKKLLTGQISLATIAQRAFNVAMKANPIGLIVGLLAAGVTWLISWNQKTGELTKDLNKIGDQFRQLANWFINLYNKSILVRAGFEELIGAWKTGFVILSAVFKIVVNQLEFIGRIIEGLVTQDFKVLKQAFINYGNGMMEIAATSGKKIGKIWSTSFNNTINGQLSAIQQKVVVSSDFIGPTEPGSVTGAFNEDDLKFNAGKKSSIKEQAEEDEKERKDALKKALETLDQANTERLNLIRQQYVKEEVGQYEFKARMIASEFAYLEQKKALQKQYGESTAETDAQILQKQIDNKEAMLKIWEEGNKEISEYIKKSYEKNAEEFDKFMAGLTDQDSDALSKSVNASVKEGEKAIKDMEDLKDAEKDILKERANAYIDLAQSIGESFAEMLLTQEASFGQFLKNTLVMALDALEKIMVLKITESIIDGTVKGPLGLIAAGAKIVAIKAAFAVAKSLVLGSGKKTKQYATGKYPVTGAADGRSYDVDLAGRPRTGFYSGPQVALFNEDPMRPEMVVDGRTTRQLLINYPQVVQGIRSMAAGYQPQFATGKYPVSSPGQLSAETDPRLAQALDRLESVLTKLLHWNPKVSSELIRRDIETLNEIDRTSGL